MQLSSENTLWLLGSLCNLHKIPFDERLVLQSFPPPHNLASFCRAATSLGLKVGTATLNPALLKSLPVPAVAFLRTPANDEAALEPAEGDVAQLPRGRTPVLLIRSDNDRVLFFKAGTQEPQTLPLAELDKYFESEAHLIGRDTETQASQVDDDGLPIPPAGLTSQTFWLQLVYPRAAQAQAYLA